MSSAGPSGGAGPNASSNGSTASVDSESTGPAASAAGSQDGDPYVYR